MNKNRKNGFTLVELLVVISILAVLAVVTVVGYTSFTKKAQESNDISLTTQMNNILDADTAGGKSYETPNDAVSALEEGGLIVTKLTPTTNKYIYVYNVNGKQGERMLLLDESYNVKFPAGATLSSNRSDYFTFVSSASEAKKYSDDGFSVYLKDSYSDTSVSLSTGLDVGDVTKVTEINYENLSSTESSVIIRTSTGTLNINAPYGTVKHYGTCENVVITAVASQSYHENGSVTVNMEVKSGHVVIEPKASVKEVSVPATSEGNIATVSVELKENSTVQTLTVDSTTAKVEVKENAKVENVVASTDVKNNITIPASVKVNEIEKTHVTSIETLTKALNDKAQYIVFDNDISGVMRYNGSTPHTGIQIESDTTIDGNNHTFITEAPRGIVLFESDLDVTIKNLKINASEKYKKNIEDGTRAIQVNEKYSILLLDNVEILTNVGNNNEGAHYGINVVAGASVELTVVNSTIRGYAALNLWGADYNVTVSSSTLVGINSYSDGSSTFAVICLQAEGVKDSGKLEDIEKTDYLEPSYLVSVTLTNCLVKCITTGTCGERPISLYGYNGTVSLINTSIELDGNYATKQCRYANISGNEKYDPQLNNRIIVDGKVIECDEQALAYID